MMAPPKEKKEPESITETAPLESESKEKSLETEVKEPEVKEEVQLPAPEEVAEEQEEKKEPRFHGVGVRWDERGKIECEFSDDITFFSHRHITKAVKAMTKELRRRRGTYRNERAEMKKETEDG